MTKERIRQIEARALAKLRQAAQEDKIEVPGVVDSLDRMLERHAVIKATASSRG